MFKGVFHNMTGWVLKALSYRCCIPVLVTEPFISNECLTFVLVSRIVLCVLWFSSCTTTNVTFFYDVNQRTIEFHLLRFCIVSLLYLM